MLENYLLVILQVNQIAATVGIGEMLGQFTDQFARRPGMDQIRPFPVREPDTCFISFLVGRNAKRGRMERTNVPLALRHANHALHSQLSERRRDAVYVHRAVALKLAVADEENIHERVPATAVSTAYPGGASRKFEL